LVSTNAIYFDHRLVQAGSKQGLIVDTQKVPPFHKVPEDDKQIE